MERAALWALVAAALFALTGPRARPRVYAPAELVPVRVEGIHLPTQLSSVDAALAEALLCPELALHGASSNPAIIDASIFVGPARASVCSLSIDQPRESLLEDLIRRGGRLTIVADDLPVTFSDNSVLTEEDQLTGLGWVGSKTVGVPLGAVVRRRESKSLLSPTATTRELGNNNNNNNNNINFDSEYTHYDEDSWQEAEHGRDPDGAHALSDRETDTPREEVIMFNQITLTILTRLSDASASDGMREVVGVRARISADDNGNPQYLRLAETQGSNLQWNLSIEWVDRPDIIWAERWDQVLEVFCPHLANHVALWRAHLELAALLSLMALLAALLWAHFRVTGLSVSPVSAQDLARKPAHSTTLFGLVGSGTGLLAASLISVLSGSLLRAGLVALALAPAVAASLEGCFDERAASVVKAPSSCDNTSSGRARPMDLGTIVSFVMLGLVGGLVVALSISFEFIAMLQVAHERLWVVCAVQSVTGPLLFSFAAAATGALQALTLVEHGGCRSWWWQAFLSPASSGLFIMASPAVLYIPGATNSWLFVVLAAVAAALAAGPAGLLAAAALVPRLRPQLRATHLRPLLV